ncbi:hypothetical protein J437_LFUL000955 [Ladona fulva]|uniref:chitinase n=1 Tax=Ladona fulva TaxID=123851 RepID=A0A8K0K7S4_LADFU|nr:hypothetical protein J437_LFUL000955 [Ladona fulva]
MVWSIETDDFHGGCFGQKFPLLHSIWDGLNGGDVPTPPDTPPTDGPPTGTYPTKTTPTKRPTTARPTPPPTEICKKAGLNPDPNSCQYFYLCTPDKFGKWEIVQYKCGEGTAFDPVNGVCTWPSEVPGCIGFAAAASVADDKKVVVCYYGSWAVYRPGAGSFDVEDIDPFLCTHIIYGFAGLSDFKGIMVSLDPWNDLEEDYGLGAFHRFTQLKDTNPDLKALLAIGGWNEGSKKYSKMVSTAEGRKTFLVNAVDFLKKYGFDGLDFDWEYPGLREGGPNDKENFAIFLSEMREVFDQHGLMMTAAVSAGKGTIDTSYDIPALSKYLDHIHVMCYDYHGDWDPFTGENAPLYWGPGDYDDYAYFNVNFTMHYWLKNGASKDKLVLGMPLYGRSFTLQDPKQNGLYAPATQPGNAGQYTEEPGYLGYNELCDMMKINPDKWKITRDPYYMAPYASKGNQWVSYDDMESIKLKYPTKTTKPHTTTTARPTPSPTEICKKAGLNPDPNDCSYFYLCTADQFGKWNVVQYRCGEGTAFNPVTGTCTWPSEVPGCEKSSRKRNKVKRQRIHKRH